MHWCCTNYSKWQTYNHAFWEYNTAVNGWRDHLRECTATINGTSIQLSVLQRSGVPYDKTANLDESAHQHEHCTRLCLTMVWLNAENHTHIMFLGSFLLLVDMPASHFSFFLETNWVSTNLELACVGRISHHGASRCWTGILTSHVNHKSHSQSGT